MNISLFPNTSLNNEIYKSLLEKYKNATISYDEKNMSQVDFLYAVHRDDVVIVDCTIPDELGKDAYSVYPILTAQVNCLNHVIVVSQTPLPLNIKPYRGIYPVIDGVDNDKGDGRIINLDLSDISEESIVVNLPNLIEKSIYEDNYARLSLENIDDLADIEKRKAMETMISESLDAQKKESSGKINVMISYRSKYHDNVMTLKALMEGSNDDCVKFREKVSYPGDFSVKVLPPKYLCADDEAHTPMRRWMLVGLLDDEIRDVDEVWVYESRDIDGRIDYLDSWWTIAELVMVSYVNRGNSRNTRVRVYNAMSETFYTITPQRYLINLSETQERRMSRLMANTRPDTMGPETNANIRKLKMVAWIMRMFSESQRKALVENFRSTIEQFVPQNICEEERKSMVDGMIEMYSNPDELSRYANDDVFKKDFWEKLSWHTSNETSCFVNDIIDVDRFMSIPMEELVDCTMKDVERAEKRGGKINFGTFFNPKMYKVEKASYDRYLWLATRMGKPTVKDAPGLERIKIYNLKEIPE